MMGSITRLGGGAGFTIGGCKLISGGLAIGGDGGFSWLIVKWEACWIK